MDQASVDTAQVAVNQAQENLKQLELVAPFAGIVQDVSVQVGATVGLVRHSLIMPVAWSAIP